MPFTPKTFKPRGTPTPKQQAQQYDKSRGTAAERGYDSRWKKQRDWLMGQRDSKTGKVIQHGQPEFVFCACGCGRLAQCIDHIDGFDGLDDEQRFNLSNLQPMTTACNTRKAKTPPSPAELQRMRDKAAERAKAIEGRIGL